MCLFYHIENYYSYQDGVHESAQSRNSKFRVDISKITPTITNHFCLSWRINLSFYRSKWSKTHNTCQYYGRFLVLVECDLDFFLTLMNRYTRAYSTLACISFCNQLLFGLHLNWTKNKVIDLVLDLSSMLFLVNFEYFFKIKDVGYFTTYEKVTKIELGQALLRL